MPGIIRTQAIHVRNARPDITVQAEHGHNRLLSRDAAVVQTPNMLTQNIMAQEQHPMRVLYDAKPTIMVMEQHVQHVAVYHLRIQGLVRVQQALPAGRKTLLVDRKRVHAIAQHRPRAVRRPAPVAEVQVVDPTMLARVVL